MIAAFALQRVQDSSCNVARQLRALSIRVVLQTWQPAGPPEAQTQSPARQRQHRPPQSLRGSLRCCRARPYRRVARGKAKDAGAGGQSSSVGRCSAFPPEHCFNTVNGEPTLPAWPITAAAAVARLTDTASRRAGRIEAMLRRGAAGTRTPATALRRATCSCARPAATDSRATWSSQHAVGWRSADRMNHTNSPALQTMVWVISGTACCVIEHQNDQEQSVETDARARRQEGQAELTRPVGNVQESDK